ncbi:MAG: methyltransferase domain-containing protein [Deltaproteobacteria bacterium]|nr:methyltransferase domain-containing protein [Deltaproteobacteria bacterium]
MKLIHDIENDIEHTIPPEGGPDTRRLFDAMTDRSLALLEAAPHHRVLDLAAGFGQDSAALGRAMGPGPGMVVSAEPSGRMISFGQERFREAQELKGKIPGSENASAQRWVTPLAPRLVRSLGEELPFGENTFDAVLCKGAMDHFMSPELAMKEIARVLKPGGRAVVALANYDSLSCRLGETLDRLKSRWVKGFVPPQEPFYRPPPDHLTRFGYASIRQLSQPPLQLKRVEGLSVLWGFPPWTRFVWRRKEPRQTQVLNGAFWLGRVCPWWADVVVIQAVKISPS